MNEGAMAHEWATTRATVIKMKQRMCKKCGVIQWYGIVSYSVLDGSRWRWHPKVGKCHEKKGEIRNERQR